MSDGRQRRLDPDGGDSEGSDDSDDDSDSTRRRFLRRGAAVAGVTLLGGGYLFATAGGDDGDYAAPGEFPLVSTRGHFAAPTVGDVELADGHSPTGYDRVGDWERRGEVCLFVHGLNVPDHAGARNRAYTMLRGLERQGYDGVAAGFSWQSDAGVWWTPAELARRNGPKLARWVRDRLDATDEPVRLVAHSLGAPVVLEALAALDERATESGWSSRPVASVTLLGGAVETTAPASDAYAGAVASACRRFDNFPKRDDRILRRVGLVEGASQLGRAGLPASASPPDGYRDHDVTDAVPDHNSYYEPGEGCLPAVVATFGRSRPSYRRDSRRSSPRGRCKPGRSPSTGGTAG